MAGAIILIGYGLVLLGVFLFLKRKGRIQSQRIKNMIFADGKVRSGTLMFSVFASWMWVTSILGSAETFAIYGIWGPIGYVGGACIAFGLFMVVLCKLVKVMPEATTYLSFLGKRYSKRVKLIYYIFAFLVAGYVLIEQAVGVATFLEQFFGSSFKWIAFCSVIIAVVFICSAGMHGLLTSEIITSLLVLTGFAVGFVLILCEGNQVHTMIKNIDKSGWMIDVTLVAAGKYFLVATVIAFSQLVFDPAYYIKGAMARDLKQLKKTYLFAGIVMWGSVSFISSTYLGWMSAYTDTAIPNLFFGFGKVIFAVLIVFIGISTVSHYLMGMFGLFTVEYYKDMLRPDATESQMLTFGRLMTVAIGLFCALTAISLEDISLLTIDVFCAIFFAAPCGGLLLGLFTKGKYGNWVIFATASGVISGLVVWAVIPASGQWDRILGTTASLLLPVIIMIVINLLDRKDKV